MVIDVFTKYTWLKPLTEKKNKIVFNGFIEIVNESKNKPKKLWVDRGREFYNSLMQELLDYNDILMYFTNNEGKLVVAERFITTVKGKIATNDSKSYLGYFS